MRDPHVSDDLMSKKSANETVIMSTAPSLVGGQIIEFSDDDFSDTSSSTVDVDTLLPLSNANINEMIRQEISPDVYGATTLKVDFVRLDKVFVKSKDAKNWQPPIIPFGHCSEVSESQGETDKDGNWLDFAF
jgi:hypothetical protein